jgi:hypothetical protein
MALLKKWFLLNNNEVQGPFQESEVQKLLSQLPTALVWGHGLSEWLNKEDWQKILVDLQEILTSLQSDMTPQWRLKQGTFEAGPFIYDQLIQVLKAHPDPGDVLISQDAENFQWKSVYDHPTIVEEVGITRRSHERVAISGLFRYEKDGAIYDSLLSSISEGGIGIFEAVNLSVGDTFKGTIQSPQLPTPINCNCEAVYRLDDSSWGLKFINLNLEAKSIVIAYTQKFNPKQT